MVAKVNEGLAGALPGVVAQMRLYLPSPNTRAILFKPIKSNIAEAHGQVRGPGAAGAGSAARGGVRPAQQRQRTAAPSTWPRAAAMAGGGTPCPQPPP
jgi:hypothetical protein